MKLKAGKTRIMTARENFLEDKNNNNKKSNEQRQIKDEVDIV